MTNNEISEPNFVVLRQDNGNGPIYKVTIAAQRFKY